MPDWVKKSRRHAGKLLDPDEEVTAAVFVRPRGRDGAKRLGSPSMRKVEALASQLDGTQTGSAASFPETNCVLVLTEQRLLVFGHSLVTGRLRGLVTEYPLGDIAAITLELADGQGAIDLHFRDGSGAELTAGTRLDRFMTAWEDATGRLSAAG